MNCPYCSRSMERGLIYSPYELSWTPGDKLPLRSKFRHLLSRTGAMEKKDVVLAPYEPFQGSRVEAWLCRACGKVVIDRAGGESDRSEKE